MEVHVSVPPTTQQCSPAGQPHLVPHASSFGQQVLPISVVSSGRLHSPFILVWPCLRQPFSPAGLAAQATPGVAASAPPTSAVPTASPLASSSKEPSLFVWRLSCSLIRPIL